MSASLHYQTMNNQSALWSLHILIDSNVSAALRDENESLRTRLSESESAALRAKEEAEIVASGKAEISALEAKVMIFMSAMPAFLRFLLMESLSFL